VSTLSQKERRERLFRHGKPVVRTMELDDMRYLWAAWQMSDVEQMEQADFHYRISEWLLGYDMVNIIEDRNSGFGDGSGPVTLVYANFDGWNLVPHAEHFPWATKRNKLRANVAFFMAQRYSKNVGCTRVFVDDENRAFFAALRKYVPIYPGCKIPGGRPGFRTNEKSERVANADHLFYVRGKRR